MQREQAARRTGNAERSDRGTARRGSDQRAERRGLDRGAERQGAERQRSDRGAQPQGSDRSAQHQRFDGDARHQRSDRGAQPQRSGQSAGRRGPTSMQDALAAYLRSTGLDTQISRERVFRAWRDVLGASLAPRARAVRFQDGELLVEVLSATHLHELTNFTGERFRVLANKQLGAPRITRVVFQLQR